jgi:uncharacterized protein (TIGR02118 family)
LRRERRHLRICPVAALPVGAGERRDGVCGSLPRSKKFTSIEKGVMVKLIVLFGHPEDAGAFEDHWSSHHVALAQKIPNVQQLEASKVTGTPDGSEPPYHRVAELSFGSVEEMQAAMGSPEGQAAVGDFQNFATGGVTVLVTETG